MLFPGLYKFAIICCQKRVCILSFNFITTFSRLAACGGICNFKSGYLPWKASG